MELANIAFHAESSGRYSALGKCMRRTKLKAKINNLFDETRGKHVLLRRYLNDAVQNTEYLMLDDISDEINVDDCENILDCAFAEPDSVTTEQFPGDIDCFSMECINEGKNCSGYRVSKSATISSFCKRRKSGDGMEVPEVVNLADYLGEIKDSKSERVVVGEETHNLMAVQHVSSKNSFQRIVEGSDQAQETVSSRVAGEETESRRVSEELVHTDTEYIDTKAMQKRCACNTRAFTKRRLQLKAASKLKGLLNLYKTMKLKKKTAKSKRIGGNLACLSHVESRKCLNSAFISEPSRVALPLPLTGSRLDSNNLGNDRVCSAIIGESTEYFQQTLDYTRSTVENSVLNIAFISSELIHSYRFGSKESGNSTSAVDVSVAQIDSAESFERSLEELKCQSKYLSLCHEDIVCSPSRYEEFAYYNNGFVMD